MKVTDAQILAVIDELGKQGRPVTGHALRAALEVRFGARAKTDRVYRLLRAARSKTNVAERATARVEPVLDEQMRALIDRAELAEYREQRHQEKWARDVLALREQVATLEATVREQRTCEQQLQELKRLLAGAQTQIERLRAELARRM